MTKIPILYDINNPNEYITKPTVDDNDGDLLLCGKLYLQFKLKSGEIQKLSIDDYMLFYIQYQKSPRECTIEEFEEKTFHMRL